MDTDNIRGCEYRICDFCKFYRDKGSGSPKRGGFAGIGICTVTDEETLASDGCDEYFVCSICQKHILSYWSCI